MIGKKKMKIALAGLAVALGLGGAVAFATPGEAQGMGRAGRIEGRIAFLKAELKITDTQQAQWSAFEQAMRQNHAAMRTLFEQAKAAREQARTENKRPSAVERMDRQAVFLKARVEAQTRTAAAFKPLYASLSDEQKKTADDLIGGRRFQGRHHGPRHH